MRPESPGASVAAVARWQDRRFAALRPRTGPSWHETLPLDLLDNPDETRRILGELRPERTVLPVVLPRFDLTSNAKKPQAT